jgi:O-antigen/teichoic acid export membrane protein
LELRFRRNAAWAIAEVAASALVLFFLYRVIVGQLGVKALGIWSLVLATTSLGRLADLGTAAGLGRFVAIAGARQEKDKTIVYVETAIITNLLLYSAIALVLWAPAFYALSLTTSGEVLAMARALLPFSLLSFVLIGVASATTGAIVGQQRSDQKSMIVIAGLILQFLASVALVPYGGLRGLAWAQIAQYALVISLGWMLFLRNYRGSWTFRLPHRWHREVFRELIGFGAKLQAATIISFLLDPTVKFLMSTYGGLEALGFFEMAQRLVQQVRQLIVMPNQVLMPGFAHLMETQPQRIEPLYHRAMTLSLVGGFALLGSVALASPIICYLWTGRITAIFVQFTVILAASWFANLVAAPAYLLGVASGRIGWNLWGHLASLTGTLVVGILLGRSFGAIGIAIGAGSMLALGSLFSMYGNCHMLGLHPLPGIRDFRLLAVRSATFVKTKFTQIQRR